MTNFRGRTCMNWAPAYAGVTLIGLLSTSWLIAADNVVGSALSLDQFTDLAIKEGVQGQQNLLTLEREGYSRTIAYRQTDSPTFSASHTNANGESIVNDFRRETDSKNTTLSVREQTPLGTQINAETAYGDAAKPSLTATAVQPLYIFTRNSALRTRKRADLNFASARDNYESSVFSLRAQARNLYYQVMLGEESIRVDERKADSSRKLLDITQALVQAGKKAPVETMRAKIRTQSDERQLQNTRVLRDQSILNAKKFIAYPLDEPLQFTSRLQFKPFPHDLDKLVDLAMVHRPALKVLRRSFDLAKLDVQETQETTRPQISLNARYGYSELDPNISKSWTLGWGATWQFFDSFITRNRVKQARIALLVARLNLEDSERETRLNIASTYLELKRTEKQIQDFQSTREQARRNVEVIRLRFQNGLDRLIDVFDAENDMRNLENEYLSLLVSFNRSKDTLTQLVGMDVEALR